MHIPVLVNPLQLRELLEEFQFWATREEIDQAIAALSPADLKKLKQFATFRVRGLGSTPRGTWEDLLGEAQLSTFEGAQGNGSGRRWNKRVDFVTYLRGAMRSIADHSKDKIDQREVLECEAVRCNGEGQEAFPARQSRSRRYPQRTNSSRSSRGISTSSRTTINCEGKSRKDFRKVRGRQGCHLGA